ncbi:MAG TPA: methyltransferase dimerization domain-containing protein, partial [Candidatus Babeliaceae bacterium]|nr:methyltransferase dimerization domain-containing protein [Candidatus Babeliaceae bacterium]
MNIIVINILLGILLNIVIIDGQDITYVQKRDEALADRLISLSDGFLISRGLYYGAKLGIADLLRSGPKTAQQLAKELDLHAPSLYRLLRMLASHGIFSQVKDLFYLNEIGELLTSDYPNTLRYFLLHEDEARWRAYGAMDYTLKTGKPAFNDI